jgi:hypothetical protein
MLGEDREKEENITCRKDISIGKCSVEYYQEARMEHAGLFVVETGYSDCPSPTPDGT